MAWRIWPVKMCARVVKKPQAVQKCWMILLNYIWSVSYKPAVLRWFDIDARNFLGVQVPPLPTPPRIRRRQTEGKHETLANTTNADMKPELKSGRVNNDFIKISKWHLPFQIECNCVLVVIKVDIAPVNIFFHFVIAAKRPPSKITLSLFFDCSFSFI